MFRKPKFSYCGSDLNIDKYTYMHSKMIKVKGKEFSKNRNTDKDTIWIFSDRFTTFETHGVRFLHCEQSNFLILFCTTLAKSLLLILCA